MSRVVNRLENAIKLIEEDLAEGRPASLSNKQVMQEALEEIKRLYAQTGRE